MAERDVLIGAAVGVAVYLVFGFRQDLMPSPVLYLAILLAGIALGFACPWGVHAGLAAGLVQPLMQVVAFGAIALQAHDGFVLPGWLALLVAIVVTLPLIVLGPAGSLAGMYLRDLLRRETSA